MKKLVVLVLVCLSLQGNAQFEKARVQVNGVVCSLCTKAVMKALNKLNFVDQVTVDLKHQQYDLRLKHGVSPDLTDLRKAIEDAGFSIGQLQLFGDFGAGIKESDSSISLNGQTFYLQRSGNNGASSKAMTIVDKHFCSMKTYQQYQKWIEAVGSCEDCFHAII